MDQREDFEAFSAIWRRLGVVVRTTGARQPFPRRADRPGAGATGPAVPPLQGQGVPHLPLSPDRRGIADEMAEMPESERRDRPHALPMPIITTRPTTTSNKASPHVTSFQVVGRIRRRREVSRRTDLDSAD
jgi:hypothetical protein